jgi:hypothetical protein
LVSGGGAAAPAAAPPPESANILNTFMVLLKVDKQ